jgi:metal-responsive CopG/Arc/MetJ family transcriptional regulator
MSTLNSPQNRPRLKKTTGGRVRCIVYLPKDEVEAIDQIAQQTDVSRSSIIAQAYYLGKQTSEKK